MDTLNITKNNGRYYWNNGVELMEITYNEKKGIYKWIPKAPIHKYVSIMLHGSRNDDPDNELINMDIYKRSRFYSSLIACDENYDAYIKRYGSPLRTDLSGPIKGKEDIEEDNALILRIIKIKMSDDMIDIKDVNKRLKTRGLYVRKKTLGLCNRLRIEHCNIDNLRRFLVVR